MRRPVIRSLVLLPAEMKRAAKAMALIRFDLPRPLPENSAVIWERLMDALPISLSINFRFQELHGSFACVSWNCMTGIIVFPRECAICRPVP